MVSFVFGGDTGIKSPKELKRLRDMAEALNARTKAPQNIGEGLNAIGQALLYRSAINDANKMEKEGTSGYATKLADALGFEAAPIPSTPSPVAAALSGIPDPGAKAEVEATSPSATDISGNKQIFVDSLLPAAIEEGKRTGVDPRIIVAQAAQETGWGKSAPGNNYFGIKSHGQSGGNSMMTHEYVNGQKVNVRDSFRAYENPADSVRGYGDFITQNPRYKPLREAQGLDAQLEALQASGYATDPNYSRSVGAIARGIQLPNEVASLDPSAGMQPAAAAIERQAPASGYVDPMVSAPNAQPQQQEAATLPALPSRDVGPAPQVAGAPQQQVAQNGQFPTPPAPPAPPAPPSPPDNRARIQKLQQALMDPWANDQQQALIISEIQRLQQESDPLRQMQLQKGQMELDTLRNGQWSKLDDGRLYNQRTGEIKDAPALANGTPSDLGLNPQYGVDANGNPVLLQLGKNGQVVQSKMPDGVSLSKEPIKLDAGTNFVLLDPITRQPVGQVPKENQQEAFDKAVGTGEGKAAADAKTGLSQALADADYSISLIDEMLVHPGRGTATGMSGTLDPRNYLAGTDATDFNTRSKQLEGRAFMQAFNSLRGGGQITEQEGAKATAAIARLSKAQSDEEYVKALQELKGILQVGKDRARQSAGGGTSAPQPPQAPSAPAPSSDYRSRYGLE